MRKIYVILLFLIVSLALFSNGGPILRNTPVIGTGNPIFKNIKDVKLVSEKLYIKLDESYSHVTVKYVLLNESDNDYNIHYAFPIDFFSEHDLKWKEKYVKDVKFSQNGNILSSSSTAGESQYNLFESKYTPLAEKRSYQIWSGGDFMRKWYYTTLTITKNSKISLEVSYSLKNRSVTEQLDTFSLSDGVYFYTSYDFMPASYWGDGSIHDFYVEVDASSLLKTGDLNENFKMKDINPAEYEQPLYLSGLEFRQHPNQIYTCQIKNFDLKKSIPLLIGYTSTNSTENIKAQRIPNNKYTLKVSGEQSKYPKSNLTDMNLETAWVAQKAVGETIEIVFKEKYHMRGFCLVNGYWKSEEAYYNNNRIKKIKLEVQEGPYREYNDDETDDYISYPKEKQEDIIELTDDKYQEINFKNLLKKAYGYSFFMDNNGEKIATSEKIEKIKITILEVYPGNKHNDTCISELILLRLEEINGDGEYYGS